MSVKTSRKPVQLDHHHFGADPQDPTFDLVRARAAHADVMRRWDDPKEGDAFKAMLLHAIQNATATEIEKHRGEIQAFLDEFGAQRGATMAKAIVKSYVATSVAAAQHYDIAKKRKWKESDWKRNHGEFSSFVGAMHAAGDVARERAQRGSYTAAPGLAHEGDYGPSYAEHMRNQAILTHAAAIAGAGRRSQDVVYRIKDKKGNVRDVVPSRGQLPKLKRGERLLGERGAGIKGDDLTMGDHSFNLMQALGVSPATSAAVAGGAIGREGMNFHQAWLNHENANYGSDVGMAYTHIESGAKALGAIAAGSPKAQVAAKVGHFVGSHGEDAEKVLGPHGRKSAYKYRGVERKVDAKNLPTKEPGGTKEEQVSRYHDALVGRIATNIPHAATHALNLASGYTAPSHGYLLDRKGEVINEAHGYGDDHYLPFKLSGMHRMKNGSYIRTRSTGGPTTEDIYAASVSGGKKFTVASRQGTYEVEFDPAFTHNKRFGDIALGMSKRYGKLLDAVKEGKVHARGEVDEGQYEDWVNAYRVANPNDANLEQNAHNDADRKVREQHSGKGRTIRLDGEGYQYALTSLQSMYPYYIKSATYTKPHDQRFWDRTGDSELDRDGKPIEGGAPSHLQRIGNSAEIDEGYVKARHIKSQDALVGYFDPTIAGDIKRLATDKDAKGVSTLSGGKVRGDLAHYQNWRNNPYRDPQNLAANTPEARRKAREAAEAAERERRRLGGGTGAQGSGRPGRWGEMGQEEKDMYNLVLATHKYNASKGIRDNLISQYAGNRQAFRDAWADNPHGTKTYVEDAHGKTPLTRTRVHGDSNDDTAMTVLEKENLKDVYRGIRDQLASKENIALRAQMQEGARKAYDPKKHAEEWDQDRHPMAYQEHRPVDLAEALYPPGTPNGNKARTDFIPAAKRLVGLERQAERHETDLGTPEEDRWHLQEAILNAGVGGGDDADAGAAAAKEEEAKVKHRTGELQREHSDFADSLKAGLRGTYEAHQREEPDPGDTEDNPEHEDWAAKNKHLEVAHERVDEHDNSAAGWAKVKEALADLHGQHPDLKLRGPNGLPMPMQAVRDQVDEVIEELENVHKQEQPRYVLSKRNGQLWITKVA
jgi:hypothetical protein